MEGGALSQVIGRFYRSRSGAGRAQNVCGSDGRVHQRASGYPKRRGTFVLYFDEKEAQKKLFWPTWKGEPLPPPPPILVLGPIFCY